MEIEVEVDNSNHPTWLLSLLRWVVLATVVGILAGLSSLVFLEVLEFVTAFRVEGRQWLIVLLPLAGTTMGWIYHEHGGRSHEGSNLLLEQIHQPSAWVPRRMAPLVLVGTWVSHLFGASVGREGTALQMSGSLADAFARMIRLRHDERRILLVAALAGGFGSVFGVPWAGAVFGLEVQALGRRRWVAIVPALTASFVGDRVLRTLGGHHTRYAALSPHISGDLLLRLAVAGALFGAAGAAFPIATHALKRLMASWFVWPPMRPMIGGLATIALVLLLGHDYQGLSLPLLGRAFDGDHLSFAVFALKLLFTVVAVGCGFFGGEVTPLFVIGATLGSALALPFGVDGSVIVAVGFCAVFAAASNAPLACIVLGMELFGPAMFAPLAVGCIVAYMISGSNGIYRSQRRHHAKVSRSFRELRGGGRPPRQANLLESES
ncbi:MAG: chloride channel protein [Ilumatobacteraceae bacterium]